MPLCLIYFLGLSLAGQHTTLKSKHTASDQGQAEKYGVTLNCSIGMTSVLKQSAQPVANGFSSNALN